MKINKRIAKKADPLLLEALAEAEGDEVLRAVVLLDDGTDVGSEVSAGEQLEPSQFPSRFEFRRKLIEQRQAHLESEIGETLEKLSELSLSPKGGKIGRSVVVEGPARQIAASLELPSVSHASLDRRIQLIGPRRHGKTARRVT